MYRSPFGAGVARICAVAAASTAREMAAQVRAGLRETPTVELRLDWLKSDRERERMLKWVENQTDRATAGRRDGRDARGAAFIATCRRVVGGGKFRGDVDAELRWLARAQEAGCEWCDLEVESLRPSGRRRPVLKTDDGTSGRPGRVMISVHDFRRTPPLARLFQVGKASVPGMDIGAVKVAAFARDISDSVRLLRAAQASTDRVVVPMGEVGLPGRILALREGSALAYAPVENATAPGQISLREMKNLYRAHELNAKTRVYGVIGNPVGHSLSPLLHNTGFVAAAVNAVYVPFLVRDLRDFLRAARELGVNGFSVTLPHKADVMRHLADCEALASEIGAVNTVVVRGDGSLYGCNTDYAGVLCALEKKFRIANSRVLILGAGGAARAAAFALARSGASVAICARRERAARDLARAVSGEVVPRRALRNERFDAVLNATPVGMYPHEGVSPLEARELHCRIAMDLIYRPERTKFLKLAASKGIATVSGVEMFVAQGVAQWEIWTRRQAPEAAMRAAVLKALRDEVRRRRSR